MSSELPRPISAREATPVREAFAVAPTAAARPAMLDNLEDLHVTYRCPCGCASVSFGATLDPESVLVRVADARGTTEQGEEVGFLVQGFGDRVAHVEVYWHHAAGAPLPLPGTLRSYA
jgi:hypothetical protein